MIDNTPETASDHQIVADIFNECKRYVILDSLAPNKLSKETQQIEEDGQAKVFEITANKELMPYENVEHQTQTIQDIPYVERQPIDNHFHTERTSMKRLNKRYKKNTPTKHVTLNRGGMSVSRRVRPNPGGLLCYK